jgi:exodeoxyribonuclease-3
MAHTLCTLNVNGIRAAEKRGFSAWLAKARPDVLCLQETRALRADLPDDLASPAGYDTRWLSAEKKGYSGVAVFSRGSANAYREGSGLEWGDLEGRVLRADLADYSACSVYVPSGSSSEERLARKFEWMEHGLEFMRRLARERRPIALCGDFNVAHTELDIHAPKRNAKNSGFLPEERAWFTKVLELGWVDVLRVLHPGVPGLYSWWSARGRAREKDLGWRLDYVLANRTLARRVTRAWIEKDAGLSDHAPVWVELDS